jgi:hypothetical protein
VTRTAAAEERPAIDTDAEADFDESATLVAVMVTVLGVGTAAGAV